MLNLLDRVDGAVGAAVAAGRPLVCGRVEQVRGLAATVSGVPARVGDLVRIGGHTSLDAEVVSVDGATATCMPLGPVTGIGVGDVVVGTGGPMTIAVGDDLLGRVLDGLGRPLDGSDLPAGLARVSVEAAPPHALARQRIRRPLGIGVRAIDTMTPVGVGQRMGIFAGSGVGKSSLLSMITRGTAADVTVLALVGERGREVLEFLEDDLGPEGLRNAVVVVATSDQPPMVRLRAAFVATRIAEHFRDEGKDVLLMMDSLTRLAMAQREIGLSAGEPPTTRGYPPTTFAMLPRLLERAGAGATGSITGLYTVLVEGDDHNEPVADAARSILDGHIVLDRHLAHAGHFPSIDVLQSVSRVAPFVTTPDQQAIARDARRFLAARREVKELVEIGAYAHGSNPVADEALARWPALEAFLQQDRHDLTPTEHSWIVLRQVVGHGA
ncbi:MAG: FliI/YscN family ATPase [Jatrophihabitans sp.]|uniref:FliI/YscN family ATPase n=1 Tax=Jatrophihabitans sp. TaxID=1932789 RepID=UPI003F7F8FE6